MKKIIFLLFVIFSLICFFKTNISAREYNMLKKLYIVSGSSDTLNYPGYNLIESDVNYNVPGIYTALYQEDITERIFTREIEVVSSDVLLNNGVKSVSLKEEHSIDNSIILKRTYTSSCDIFVYEEEGYVKLLFKYDDSSVIVSLFDSSIFGFIDLVYVQESNKLYLTGSIFTDSLDIYIAEYSLNGSLNKERIIKGNNVDNVTNIHVINQYLYLVGYTTSSNGDFIHTSYKEDSFVLQLDVNSFEIVNYLNLGETGIDYIKSSVYFDALYLVKHYFISGVPVCKIIVINDHLEVINTESLGTVTHVVDAAFKVSNNAIFYFCSIYDETLNDDISTLYQISKDLKIKKIDSYYDELSIPIDLNIVGNEISLLYSSMSKEENYPTYIRIISEKTLKFILDNRIYDRCYFNELGNLDLIYDEKLKSYEYSLVYASSLGTESLDKNIEPVIMYNNKQVKEDKYLSDVYYDMDTFGTYTLTYYYKFDFFDLVLRKKINVDHEITVDSGNSYYKGLILNFKGKGYLNNNIIESGYIVNDVGNYELRVMGYDNEVLIYNFNVVDDSTFKEELIISEISLNMELKEQEEKENIILENNKIDNKIIEKNYESNIWYIIIPILTLLISITTFTFIGRKVK